MIRIKRVSGEESKNYNRYLWPVRKPNMSESGKKLDENYKPLKGRAKQGYHMEIQFMISSTVGNPSKLGQEKTFTKVISYKLKDFFEFIETNFNARMIYGSELDSIGKWNELEKKFLKDESSIEADIFEKAFAVETKEGIHSLYGLVSYNWVVYNCYTTKPQKGKSPCKDKNGIEKRFSVNTGEIKNTMSTPDTSEWIPFWNTTEVRKVEAPALIFSESLYDKLRKKRIEEERGLSNKYSSTFQF